MKNQLKTPIFLLLFLLLPTFLSSCSPFSKKAQEKVYYGNAEADEVDITSEISGKVKEIKVEEGRKIKIGDLIAIIDSNENKLKVEQEEISVKNAENELGKVEEGNRVEEIKAQQASVDQISSSVKQAEITVEQSKINVNSAQITLDQKKQKYEDTNTLYQKGVSTKYELDAAKTELDIAENALTTTAKAVESNQSQAESLKAQLESANQKLNLLLNGATDKTKLTAAYAIENAKKSYDLAKLLLDKNTVSSSTTGTIQNVNFHSGEYVSPGSPIATIIDTDNTWVKIFVSEKDLASIKLGQQVKIKCDFLPNTSINGKITYISSEAEFTPINVVTKEDRTKLVFAVKVKILNHLDAIKPGMLLDVSLE